MARLYSNENFPKPVVAELRALGHDVTTIQERGRGGEAVTDPEVLKLASAEARAVLTLNRRDFLRLHGESAAHSGIVVCTVDPDFPGQALRIHAALVQAGELSGQLVRVYRDNAPLRLPVGGSGLKTRLRERESRQGAMQIRSAQGFETLQMPPDGRDRPHAYDGR